MQDSYGFCEFYTYSSIGLLPVSEATITVYTEESFEEPFTVLKTDISGKTTPIKLLAPSLSYSLSPSAIKPYATINIQVSAPNYEPVTINGIEILPQQTAIQAIAMSPTDTSKTSEEEIIIPAHTLYGDYPPKIPEEEIKTIPETGEIVLSRVVIPEYVIVHDGIPSDSAATNYYVRYKDYIKNVASSEIYSTWPEAAIYANILAIMSVTLNRVFTEWYRGQGYHFTITSSTAYDQKWIYGRNTFQNIDRLVDSVFANYLSRPGVKQPIFTAYCDGKKTSCKGLSQWGSKYLAEEGYSAIEILRYYYGNDLYINTATQISGVPSSYPGYDLAIGASGSKVKQLQQQLNRIAQNYPAIPKLETDGIYGPATSESVKTFQKIFGLSPTGVTDYATWYEISDVYVGVSRIAEL